MRSQISGRSIKLAVAWNDVNGLPGIAPKFRQLSPPEKTLTAKRHKYSVSEPLQILHVTILYYDYFSNFRQACRFGSATNLKYFEFWNVAKRGVIVAKTGVSLAVSYTSKACWRACLTST